MKSKNALLIYSPEDIKKNEWFIRHLTESAAERDIVLKLMTPDAALDLFADISARECDDVRPDLVINRARDHVLSQKAEELGIRSINNSRTIRIGNDKYAEYELFKKMGLEPMDTVRADILQGSPGDHTGITEQGDCVLKSVSGHGGDGVFRISGISGISSIISSSDPSGWIVQKMCDTPGVDVRVYMIGKKIVSSVIRTSKDDFRSNFSLGGKADEFEPDDDMKDTCLRLAEELDSDYIGVDFIKDKGRWIINEIEDAAGARMLYSLGVCDIAGLFMDYISEIT